MQFPVDPGPLWLTPVGWLFLAFIGVYLPFVAVRQQRRFASTGVLPSRMRLYVGTLVTHVMFVAFVWSVSRTMHIGFLSPYRPTMLHVAVGLAALAFGLLPLHPRLQLNNPMGRERAKLMAPRTAREHAVFYLLCLFAGIAEELTYRGMLFTLLAVLIGGWWVPALLTSVSFDMVHLFQGWKSAGLAGVMGLREHIVVGLTGSLFVAMVVHMLHDVITGTIIAARVRRSELNPSATKPQEAHAVS